MPDVTVSRTYLSAWVDRMLPAVLERATGINGHRVVQKLLERRGVAPDENGYYSIEGLSPRDKAEVLIDHFMFSMTLQYEEQQAELARSADRAALIEAFDAENQP